MFEYLSYYKRLVGEASKVAKLTEDRVIFIRQSTLSDADLGRMFLVTRQAIGNVKKWRSWKHVGRKNAKKLVSTKT